jgi:hypothetical protein
MRGLPDSAVYGTYRRFTRGARRKPKAQTSFLEFLSEWLDEFAKRELQKEDLRKIRGY